METKFRWNYLFLNRGLIIIIIFLSSSLNAQVRFPYESDFHGTNVPSGITVPDKETNSVQFTNDGILLTNAGGQFGSIALDEVSFNSTNGIIIEFEFTMYEGGGGYGDGLSFFLYDASKTLQIGGGGGSLGYLYSRHANPSRVRPGLSGGYLGVGIDVFGNFKKQYFGVDAERNSGIEASWSNYRNNVTLRGAMHPTGLVGGGNRVLGYSGYPVLISCSTIDNTANRVINANGGYDLFSTNYNIFELRSDGISDVPGDSNYRKAIISLLPHVDGGFKVSVSLQHGREISEIINNFHYKTSFTYIENANAVGNTESAERGPNTQEVLNAAVPAEFKLGFAGSTGGASQKQLIHNLKVTLPYMPVVGDDSAVMCNRYKPVNISLFDNDVIYNGSLTGTPTSGNSNNYIDYNSFRFEDSSGNVLTNNASYEQEGVGVWSYNNANGQLSFNPTGGYVGTATIFYSIKGFNTNGGPFGQDIYRSQPVEVSVEVKNCNSISNPNIKSHL